jgi:hypothetical protein
MFRPEGKSEYLKRHEARVRARKRVKLKDVETAGAIVFIGKDSPRFG